MSVLTTTFEPLYQYRVANYERQRYVTKIVDQWDQPIRQMLIRLAKKRWPPKYILGFIPVANYQLYIKWTTFSIHQWSIERDIPHSSHLCEAYRIQLRLNELGQPVIVVQSGDHDYPVSLLVADAIEATLAQVADDTPLITTRSQKDTQLKKA